MAIIQIIFFETYLNDICSNALDLIENVYDWIKDALFKLVFWIDSLYASFLKWTSSSFGHFLDLFGGSKDILAGFLLCIALGIIFFVLAILIRIRKKSRAKAIINKSPNGYVAVMGGDIPKRLTYKLSCEILSSKRKILDGQKDYDRVSMIDKAYTIRLENPQGTFKITNTDLMDYGIAKSIVDNERAIREEQKNFDSRKVMIVNATKIFYDNPHAVRAFIKDVDLMNYEIAKRIIANKDSILEEEQKYKENTKKKADRIRELYPYSTVGRTDDYIIKNEQLIKEKQEKAVVVKELIDKYPDEINLLHKELNDIRSKINWSDSWIDLICESEDYLKKFRDSKNVAINLLRECPDGVTSVLGYIDINKIDKYNISVLCSNEQEIRKAQIESDIRKREYEIAEPQFLSIKRKYALAVKKLYPESKKHPYDLDKMKEILSLPEQELRKHEEELENRIITFPVRFSLIYKNYKKSIYDNIDTARANEMLQDSYGDFAARLLSEFELEEKIINFLNNLDDIKNSQNAFSKHIRSIAPMILSGWGYYNYDFETNFSGVRNHNKTLSMNVWQLFHKSCCLDDSVSYEYFPEFKNNRIYKAQLESTYSYINSVFDKLLEFISQVKNSSFDNNIFVLLANTDNLSNESYDNNFRYFKTILEAEGLPYGTIEDLCSHNGNLIVIICDVITENSNLQSMCANIYQRRYRLSSLGDVYKTKIVYISLLKCYDAEEVERLYEKKSQEIEAANRRKRAEEEKRIRIETNIRSAQIIAEQYSRGFMKYFPKLDGYNIDAASAELIIRKKTDIIKYDSLFKRLNNNVASWQSILGIPYYFFYYYYPTRFTNVSSESQTARSLIYEFKDGIRQTRVKELVKEKLQSTFKTDDLKELTFVCIPASTNSSNKMRYENFSNQLCDELNMKNGYPYITILREKLPSHLGGSDQAEYSFDSKFFNGAIVILFDDIVTRGGSMSSMKNQLENMGATVFCAISIGRTYSDYYGDVRRPHPYTGNI